MEAATAQNPQAWFFDGVTSRRRETQPRIAADRLDIIENGAVLASWPLGAVRRVNPEGPGLRLKCLEGASLARLIVADPALAAQISRACPSLDKDDPSRRNIGRIVFWSLGAVASIFALATWGVPFFADLAARHAPPAFERKIGDIADRQLRAIFSGKACDNPEGARAFDKMMGRLGEAVGVPAPQGAVIASRVPNAVALPGGRTYLFSALLSQARTPDEIAGVMAHELGHVKHRDAMRRLAQVSANSFLFGLLFGDVSGAGVAVAVTRELRDASYSRQAEYDADGAAIDAMEKLNRPAAAAAELMMRITGRQSEGLGSLVASHPLTQARLERMKKADEGRSFGAPLLTDAEWKALKSICGAGAAPTPPADKQGPKPRPPAAPDDRRDGGKPDTEWPIDI